MVRLYCNVTSSLANLGTKLRVAVQSSRDKRNTKHVSLVGTPPWLDDATDPEPGGLTRKPIITEIHDAASPNILVKRRRSVRCSIQLCRAMPHLGKILGVRRDSAPAN
jgi:hypothetical protein